jgi:hypothetical protein
MTHELARRCEEAGVSAKIARPDRFYGDPVTRFRAMADAVADTPVDRAHFRMWCRIAADEIAFARSQTPELDQENE